MSETLIIKIVATGLMVSLLSFVGSRLNRLLCNVSTSALRTVALAFAALAVVCLLLLLGINPAKSSNPSVKSLGDLLAFGTLGGFGLFVLAGFVLKMRD